MTGTALSQQETADVVVRTLDILGILRAENNASFVPTWLEGRGAESFWLELGGWDKHISVCQSVFPRPLRTSLKHKLASLMNLFPSHRPLLQNDTVNQAKDRGTGGAESVSLFVSAEGHLTVRELFEDRGASGHKSKWDLSTSYWWEPCLVSK